MKKALKPCLTGTVFVILLLIVSIPLTLGISYNIPVFSTIFHDQQAMAQKTTTSTSPSSTVMPNFLTYHNSTYGINIQYPSDWRYEGSENTSIANNASNNNTTGQVQPIVTFLPQDRSVHALVTVGSVGLPPIFQSINIDNMSSFAPFVIKSLQQSTPGFKLVESNTTTVKTVVEATTASDGNESTTSAATIPAQKIVYTADGPVHKTMAVYAIKGDKAFFISYPTEAESVYSSYLPIAQKMTDSFQIVNAEARTADNASTQRPQDNSNTTTNTGTGNAMERTMAASPDTTSLSNTATTSTSLVSSSSSSSATSQKVIADFNTAREQLLLAWNSTGFRPQFDTYVNSADAYGIYEEHKSNVFKPGEPIILYVEPIGFTHMQINGDISNSNSNSNNNSKLYLINMTAGIVLSDKQGNILLGRENIPLLGVKSHHKNTELFANLRLTQSSPFPEGGYVITYTVTDAPSGKSFKIVKDILIRQ